MSQPDPSIPSTADIRTARVLLIGLVALWAALASWTWRNGDTLIDAAVERRFESASASVAADGAPPTGRSPDSSAPMLDGAGSGSDLASLATDVPDESGAGAVGADDEADATREATGTVAEPTGDDSPLAEDDPEATGAPDPEPEGGAGGGIESGPGSELRAGPVPATDAGAGAAAASGSDPEVADVAPSDEADAPDSVFELRRLEEIGTLSSLLEQLRFEPLGDAPSAESREPLERAFEILFLYPDTRLDVVVESRETNDAAFDLRLGRERAEAIIDYLGSRGIERERLSAGAGEGRGLPLGEHRVRVTVEDTGR